MFISTLATFLKVSKYILCHVIFIYNRFTLYPGLQTNSTSTNILLLEYYIKRVLEIEDKSLYLRVQTPSFEIFFQIAAKVFKKG